VRALGIGRQITCEVGSFETTTCGLLLLLAWLTEMGCTHVAMEATGLSASSDGGTHAGKSPRRTSSTDCVGSIGV
jgi:hypothetical protein